ncbi:MAG: HNH endonuclease [Desulfurellales bacterium]|nr:MAG: HNH endonuclease [Desulfurellales bacterium]
MTGFSITVCAIIDARSGGYCEACGARSAVERHHRRPRQQGGSKRPDTNLASNGLALCRHCHHVNVENNRAFAYLMGWLLSQNMSPDRERVMYRGEWMLLGDDGSVEPWQVAA